AQYEAACNAGAATTVRGCRAWILSLEQRASVGDRAALHSQALAYSAIVLYLPADSEEKSASQVAALDLYRRLIALDPADADALLGAATLTGDRAERLRLLKRVVDARP